MPTADEIALLTVQEVMSRWPAAVPIFHKHRIRCPGCPITPFCTVADAAALHHIPLPTLLAELANISADALTS